jgi:hypothetical protein
MFPSHKFHIFPDFLLDHICFAEVEANGGEVLVPVGRLHVAPRQLLYHHSHRLHLAHPLTRHLEELFQALHS